MTRHPQVDDGSKSNTDEASADWSSGAPDLDGQHGAGIWCGHGVFAHNLGQDQRPHRVGKIPRIPSTSRSAGSRHGLHHRGTTFEIRLDFLDHALLVQTADGRNRVFGLGDGMPVADFDARLHALLSELGIDVEIKEQPFGVSMTTPFPEDVEHASWDREAIERFGRILDWTDTVFEEFSGWFNGKTSPVHLFWHGLDLAVTRFSGRAGLTIDADPVNQEAYSHEVISFGFWAGDDTVGDGTYYSYTAPEPEGLREQPLSAGSWIEYGSGSLAVLPYETVRGARDPRPERALTAQEAGPAERRPGEPASHSAIRATPMKRLGSRLRQVKTDWFRAATEGVRCSVFTCLSLRTPSAQSTIGRP